MAYRPPTYNQTGTFWGPTHTIFTGPPDLVCPIQLYIYSKASIDITPSASNEWVPPIYVRLAPTDFDTVFPPMVGGGMRWVDPPGNIWYYLIRWWERMHAGFPNEYIQLLVEQCTVGRLTPDPAR